MKIKNILIVSGYLSIGSALLCAIGMPNLKINDRALLKCAASGATPLFAASHLIPSAAANPLSALVSRAVDGSGDSYAKVADFDGNARADFVALGSGSSNNVISVFKNPSLTSLGQVQSFTLGTAALLAFKIADLDNDGKIDIVAVNSNTLFFLWGTGNGNFTTTTKSAGSFLLSGISVGDYNGDSKLDLSAPTEYGLGSFRNLGSRSFASPTNYIPFFSSSGPNILSFFANADNRIDVIRSIVPDGFFNEFGVEVLRSTGAAGGSLAFNSQEADHYLSGELPQDLTSADLNGDGKDDVVVTLTDNISIKILINNGTGFVSSAPITVGSNSATKRVTVGDLNHDNKVDIIIANKESNTISVLIGRGNGTFKPAIVIASPGGPSSVALADLDKDGDQDIVVSNSVAASKGFSVIENLFCSELRAIDSSQSVARD